jgi:hypothetical protein
VGADVPVRVAAQAFTRRRAASGADAHLRRDGHGFYAKQSGEHGEPAMKSGAITVVQRAPSDLRLNPHLHVVFLEGVYREDGAELTWQPLGHLQTREVGAVLERAVRRMARYLRRRSTLVAAAGDDDGAGNDDVGGEQRLAASAISGQTPPGRTAVVTR